MKNISFGLYRFLPGCQKSDIKETKNGIYFCTGESNAEVMLGRITYSYYFLRKQLFRNVASLLCIPPFFDAIEVEPSGSTSLLVDIHPRHLGRAKERAMPGWP